MVGQCPPGWKRISACQRHLRHVNPPHHRRWREKPSLNHELLANPGLSINLIQLCWIFKINVLQAHVIKGCVNCFYDFLRSPGLERHTCHFPCILVLGRNVGPWIPPCKLKKPRLTYSPSRKCNIFKNKKTTKVELCQLPDMGSPRSGGTLTWHGTTQISGASRAWGYQLTKCGSLTSYSTTSKT